MPTAKKAPAKKAAPVTPPRPQIPRAQPEKVEIRVNGRIQFANLVYEPRFDVTDDTLTFTADRNPTWIDAPPVPPPTRFAAQDDPRDGEQIIHRVHSGRRDIIEPPAVEAPEVEAETEEL
jgi:hypothetical protein